MNNLDEHSIYIGDQSFSFHRPEDEADQGLRNVVSNSTVHRRETQKPSALQNILSLPEFELWAV